MDGAAMTSSASGISSADRLERELSNVAGAVEKVEGKIDALEVEIKAGMQAFAAGTPFEGLCDEKLLSYLDNLREEKKQLRKEKEQLREEKKLLMERQQSRAECLTGQRDTTSLFIAALDLPEEAPRFEDLSQVFNKDLTSKGSRVALPVSDTLFQSLTIADPVLEAIIAPVSASGAHALSDCISVALRRALHLDASDEITIAGFIDIVMASVSDWVSRRFYTGIKRKRNSTEESLTLRGKRPDLLWLVDGTLLFKGEDKTDENHMTQALGELLEKMKDWSSNYHGQVDFLLCYAAAGQSMQFCVLKRGDRERVHRLGRQIDLRTVTGVLTLVRYTILVSSIICVQRRQLQAAFLPLGATVQRQNGTTVTWYDGYVRKTVDLALFPMSDMHLQRLKRLYEATQGCPNVVQALSPPWTKCTSLHPQGRYTVDLKPLGIGLTVAPSDPAELRVAIRCILCGLKALHTAGFGHGDVRWPNIIAAGRGHFVLIDLECAVELGELFSTDAREISSMPVVWHGGAVLENGRYIAQSDLRQVAYMLEGISSVQDLARHIASASSVDAVLTLM